MKKYIALLMGLLSTTATAGTATLTWEPPTTRTDGTSYTNYGGYKIYYGLTGQSQAVIDLPDSNNVLRTYTVENLNSGTWNFQMTAYDSDNAESDKSGIASKVIPSSTPLPPDPTFVTVETIVYNLVKRENGFVMVPIGTVALGTPCDRTQSVNNYFVVPYVTGQVTWLGTVKPVVVIGSCSAN